MMRLVKRFILINVNPKNLPFLCITDVQAMCVIRKVRLVDMVCHRNAGQRCVSAWANSPSKLHIMVNKDRR